MVQIFLNLASERPKVASLLPAMQFLSVVTRKEVKENRFLINFYLAPMELKIGFFFCLRKILSRLISVTPPTPPQILLLYYISHATSSLHFRQKKIGKIAIFFVFSSSLAAATFAISQFFSSSSSSSFFSPVRQREIRKLFFLLLLLLFPPLA